MTRIQKSPDDCILNKDLFNTTPKIFINNICLPDVEADK